MNSHDVIRFLKQIASSADHRHLLDLDVHRIDYAHLSQLATQQNLDIPSEELRRAVRQFKRMADSPFIIPDDSLL